MERINECVKVPVVRFSGSAFREIKGEDSQAWPGNRSLTGDPQAWALVTPAFPGRSPWGDLALNPFPPGVPPDEIHI